MTLDDLIDPKALRPAREALDSAIARKRLVTERIELVEREATACRQQLAAMAEEALAGTLQADDEPGALLRQIDEAERMAAWLRTLTPPLGATVDATERALATARLEALKPLVQRAIQDRISAARLFDTGSAIRVWPQSTDAEKAAGMAMAERARAQFADATEMLRAANDAAPGAMGRPSIPLEIFDGFLVAEMVERGVWGRQVTADNRIADRAVHGGGNAAADLARSLAADALRRAGDSRAGMAKLWAMERKTARAHPEQSISWWTQLAAEFADPDFAGAQ